MINYFLFLILLFIINYFLLVGASKGYYLKNLIQKKTSDKNMHKNKIYQNTGVIVLGLFIISSLSLWIIFGKELNITEKIPRPLIFFISISSLYLISVLDFIKKIHPIVRLFFQLIIVFISLSLINFPIVPTNLVPLKLQFLMVIIFWVYIINITIFIDGLDGMISLSIMGVMITSIVFLIIYKIMSINFYLATLLLPFLLSFFILNKPEAKIFLNDSGSIPLGYLMGFFLINFLQNEQYFFFISIFLYFILDVTFTLFIKVKKKIVPWARLFDYFFLKPVIKGKQSHWYVLKFVFFYFLIMMFLILILYYLNLSLFYLSIYSLLFSIFMLKKFNKFSPN